MNNFELYNPTRILFGKGMEYEVGKRVAKYSKKILLHYGQGSAERSGLLNIVRQSLREAGVEFIELGGVQEGEYRLYSGGRRRKRYRFVQSHRFWRSL